MEIQVHYWHESKRAKDPNFTLTFGRNIFLTDVRAAERSTPVWISEITSKSCPENSISPFRKTLALRRWWPKSKIFSGLSDPSTRRSRSEMAVWPILEDIYTLSINYLPLLKILQWKKIKTEPGVNKKSCPLTFGSLSEPVPVSWLKSICSIRS